MFYVEMKFQSRFFTFEWETSSLASMFEEVDVVVG